MAWWSSAGVTFFIPALHQMQLEPIPAPRMTLWKMAVFFRMALIFSSFSGCLHKSPDVRYRAISDETFILTCENSASISNSSEHPVQWFWQPRDGSALKLLSHEEHQNNFLWFEPITVKNSGTYLFTNRFVFSTEPLWSPPRAYFLHQNPELVAWSLSRTVPLLLF